MKRQQAIKMLRMWHEECIKAAKALPAPFHALVEEQERTYTDGTTYKYRACVWNEEEKTNATRDRGDYIYHFRTDETNIRIFNEELDAFKADLGRIIEESNKHSIQ